MVNVNSFFQYMRGYLRIKVWGYSPERFMNLCGNHGIRLWDVCRRERCYEMYIGLSDFFRLRPIVRKTGTRAVVLERYGLPFLIQKIRKRKIFAVGLPCCIAFLIAMSQFVWAIDFEGNHSLTDDVLMDFLEENGVDFGVPRNQVDIEALEAAIRENFDVVTWTSARIEGTRFIVKIKENDLLFSEEEDSAEADQQMEQDCPGSDLIANADGIVHSILTRSGVPKVQAGDVVEKGDVLVSGQVPVNADDGTVREYQYCHADADILVDYGITVREGMQLNYEYKSYTGREKKNFFVAVSGKKAALRLHRCSYAYYDTVTDLHQVCLLSQIWLPLYYGFEIHREYLPVEAVYQQEQAERILQERLLKNIETLDEKGVQIIQKDVTIDTVGNSVLLKAVLRARGPVGTRQPIEIQEVPAENETMIGSSQ